MTEGVASLVLFRVPCGLLILYMIEGFCPWGSPRSHQINPPRMLRRYMELERKWEINNDVGNTQTGTFAQCYMAAPMFLSRKKIITENSGMGGLHWSPRHGKGLGTEAESGIKQRLLRGLL